MKKILHITLIFLLIFNAAGYVFTYWQLKVIFKKTALKKIEQAIPDEQLQLITAHLDGQPLNPEICTRINKKEFRLNNEMYDIVRYEVKDSLIFYYCLKDENENMLEAAFINHIEGNAAGPVGTVPIKNLLKSFSGDWENYELNNYFFCSSEKFFPAQNNKIEILFKRIPVPPPEYFSC